MVAVSPTQPRAWAQSVEAAREGGMAAVVVAGQQPLYELGAADLVVRQLDELSLVNLKQLFRNEAHVAGSAVRRPPQHQARVSEPARGWRGLHHCEVHVVRVHCLLKGQLQAGPAGETGAGGR